MLQAFNISKSFTGKPILEDVTFSISTKEIVGLVGRNGCGKSTLFKIILGIENCDEGNISHPKGYKIGYLDQHISFTKPTVLEECCQVLPEEEQFDFYKAEKILFGLGFEEDDLYKEPSQFSGGYQLRINLTKTLLQNPDLLLLDEPTNYLDIVSLRWMRQFLKSFSGEAVIITHDRDFMDSVTTHTMGIHRRKLKKVKGNTSKFYEQIAMDEEIYEKTRANQDKKIKDMEKFVERFRAKASKATQAQSKMKQIEKIDRLEGLSSQASLGFRFNYKETPAKSLLKVKEISFGYKEDQILFKDLSFEVKPKDRIAVIGKNGKGKSTLLNVLFQDLKTQTGELYFHPSVDSAYYQQTNSKNLNPNATIADEIGSANVNLDISAIRSICGAMMFPGADADKKIKVLSGGEQGRVLLGKILAQSTNLLFLDEPSNHLDMESVEFLTDEVNRFPGGVVFVSHNEDMVRHLANKLIIFRKDQAELFLGTYDEFLEKFGWEEEGGPVKQKTKSKNKKEARKERAEAQKKLKPLKKDIKTAEEAIADLDQKIKGLNDEILKKVESGDSGSELQDLYKEVGQLQISQETHYNQLEKLMTELESLES